MSEESLEVVIALRTAFVSRFIVLREARRSRAHRAIEEMSWDHETSAEDLADRFRNAFISNGDKMEPVERDITRALEHAHRSITSHFTAHYCERSSLNFKAALEDYKKSNELLFGDSKEELEDNFKPREGGWRL